MSTSETAIADEVGAPVPEHEHEAEESGSGWSVPNPLGGD